MIWFSNKTKAKTWLFKNYGDAIAWKNPPKGSGKGQRSAADDIASWL